ncbi:MAG: hypothetical protein RBT22_10180 [Aliarcobacter sp.]|nr:hypothetical protein [Aliarcobacter sp.]
MSISIFRTIMFSLVLVFSLSGCGGLFQLIKVEEKGGVKNYRLQSQKLGVQSIRNIDSFFMRVESVGDKVMVSLSHDLNFTQGTGTPNDIYCPLCPPSSVFDPKEFTASDWDRERWWFGLNDFKIDGINTISSNPVKYEKNIIFDSWSETITNTYKKDEFINFAKKSDKMYVNISSIKRNFSSNKIEFANIKKFANCLEDEKQCIESK